MMSTFYSGQYEATVAIATSLIGEYPKCAEFFTTRGRAYANLGRLHAAAKDLEYSIGLNPQSCKSRLMYSIVSKMQGRTDAAVMNLKACLVVEPNNLDALYTLGGVYWSTDQFDLAKSTYDSIMEQFPEDVEARVYRASSLRKMKSFDEAQSELDLVLAADPENLFAHEEMGQLMYDQNDFDAAVDWFNVAMRLYELANEHPEMVADLYDSRGKAWAGLGNYSEAKRDFTKSVQTYENAIAHIHLADLQLNHDLKEDACEELQKAINLDPNPKERAELEELDSNCS